jgi:peptidoglycan/LPS O-acetylase OafA/YrhL
VSTSAVPDAHGAPAQLPLRRLGFVPAFDGVRAIAVLLVVSFHAQILDPGLYGRFTPRGGSLGVDIFFVLSGFLITALLLREDSVMGRVRLGAFYQRRALRLLPALVLLVLASIAYAVIDNIPADLERSSVLSVLFYYANWKIAYADSFPVIAPGLAHVWSLSVEEQFYIVWPVAMMLLLGVRRRLSVVLGVIVAAILAIVVARAVLFQDTPPARLYFRTDMRADSLLVGALAAQLWVRGLVPRRPLRAAAWVAFAVVLWFVLFTGYRDRMLFYGGFTVFACAVAIILLAIVDDAWGPDRVLRVGWLCAIGMVSYGIYLWHYFVFTVLAEHSAGWPAQARVVVGLGITAAITVFSWFVVERRFLRLKDRHRARRQ